jgi:hypothetical protein
MVGSAYAVTYQCTAAAAVNARVRGEDRTALLGDLVVRCDGDVPDVRALTANIQIFTSVNITNRIVNTGSGATDALLTLNEPAPALQILDTAKGATGIACTTTEINAGTCKYPNIFSGLKAGDNSLLWLNVPLGLVAPGGSTPTVLVTSIRIGNVRGNAPQAFSAGQTYVPTPITMTVTLYSVGGSIPIYNPTQQVAAVLKGLDFQARNCKDDGGISTSYSQCSSWGSTSGTSTSHTLSGVLKFIEGFDGGWKTQIGSLQNGAILGTITGISESGYVNYPGTSNVAGTVAPYGLPAAYGVAGTATRLIARFNNIPTGVSVFVTPREVKPYYDSAAQVYRYTSYSNPPTNTTWTSAYLVSLTDPYGYAFPTGYTWPATGAFDTTKSDPGGATCANVLLGDSSKGVVQVTITGGAGGATWEIFTTPVGTSTSVIEYVSFGVTMGYSARPDINSPALTGTTPGTVTGNFAPISSDDKMSASSPIPRFADLPISQTLMEVKACRSTLLFPFVTARGGFDTGIAISNTTLDNSVNVPGGTDKWPMNTRAQTGVCKIWYVGDKEDGTSLAKPIQTSGTLAAGKQLVYTLFGGGAGIDATPGFQGYLFAVCDFELAHGFAFISDLGAQKLAMGYLALVVDKGLESNRAGRIEALNN